MRAPSRKQHKTHLADCRRGATWATRVIPSTGKGAPAHEIRLAFLKQWVCSIKPAVFVNRHDPGRLLDEEEFNTSVRPFSDAKNTADLLRREFEASVDSIAYEPGLNQGVVTLEGRRCINTWTPTRIEWRKGDVTLFEQFMEHLFPVEADRNGMKKWIATLIAKPEVRMRYSQLLMSTTQGVGKGTLMEKILAPLVGWHNTSVPSEKQLVDSSFNSWLVRRRLVLLHEIYAGNSKKAYDNLKTYVTEDKERINEKNMKEYEINICPHFMLSSNSKVALKLVKGDRRWAVPKVVEAKKDDDFWVKLNAWLVSGGLEAIHYWAHEYIAAHGAVGTGEEAPPTIAKEELIERSRSEGARMVLNLGRVAVRSEEKIVLTDRSVRKWVATVRDLGQSDPKLESLMTIRQMLAQAGMRKACKVIIKGLASWAYANPKAEASSWEDLKPDLKEVEAVCSDDVVEEELVEVEPAF